MFSLTSNVEIIILYLFVLLVNLAVGLKLEFPGKEIGLLDADVFGPSLPIMMNLKGQPEVDASRYMNSMAALV